MASIGTSVCLSVGGMTCINCQNKIEKELQAKEGILEVRVSYNKGIAWITYDAEQISLKEIICVIESMDYQVRREESHQQPAIDYIIGILAVILLLYTLLQRFGILNLLAPSQLADTGMGYGMLFITGLLTSVHCIAMCGGINLSQCVVSSSTGKSKSGFATYLPSVLYNLGRVVSYTAIGFVCGFVGMFAGSSQEAGMSAFWQGVLKLAAGMVMVVMGINMLGIFPWLRKLNPSMPRFLVRRIGKEKRKSKSPFFVGILNGFMPCGPLQSMWIVALASGNPIAGALSMFLFSVGTVPLMLGFGSVVSALGKKFTKKVMTAGSILVVVLGLAMLSQGGSLSGLVQPKLLYVLWIVFNVAAVLLSLSYPKKTIRYGIAALAVLVTVSVFFAWNHLGNAVSSTQANQKDMETELEDGQQVVRSTLSTGKYPNITVQAGIPVKWIIDAPEGSINGCNYRMLISDYDIEHTFETGENVIEFTPEKTGTISYSCWMGMIYGNIFVVDKDTSGNDENEYADNLNQDEIDEDIDVPVPAGVKISADTIGVAVPAKDSSGNSIQEITVELTEKGFSPAVIVLKAGLDTVWNIKNNMSEDSVDTEVLISYYSAKFDLQHGNNIFSVIPTDSFDISTGDYKHFGYIKVVEDVNQIDQEAIRKEVEEYKPLIYPKNIYEQRVGGSCCG